MDRLGAALRGANHSAPAGPAPGAAPQRLRPLLVVGAGGALGSALLGQALVAGRFARVTALVDAPLATAVRGLGTLHSRALAAAPRVDAPGEVDTALLVYERARHANGRDEAFHRPEPAAMPVTAAALGRLGVRRLVVVVPHTAALLPAALRHGFASHDEAAVAALGFEQLVFVRSAQAGGGAAPDASRAQRLAALWFAQLRWMIPATEQPVRAARLAPLLVEMARRLPAAPPGTRVLPPELLSRLSTLPPAAAEAGWDAWLAGAPPVSSAG